MRKNLFSGTKWEDQMGYSRAVKIGNTIEVSGTVSVTNSGEIVGENDAYLQTRFILMRIQNALESLGANIEDVIRTRVYVKNMADWEKVGKAHQEFFSEIKPANSLIAVAGMIDESYLVEIEASAVVLN
ncbi:RidA family protein [Jiulongibacter sediminis]|uniref:Endoribonuclease L-PSP n=1 Tax=Jiulongibacter sediminis TaxID=1605367 RepID=A0A0P7C3P0_9BACT|nr:RidA family protein [Jiulongibacter sediminis]KPM47751.1 endoribonuclease L-PSP [Jiulongibacter sediminis]TBX23934.1 endoribonuclease L-PSP [Jiulongibacter sediminis]